MVLLFCIRRFEFLKRISRHQGKKGYIPFLSVCQVLQTLRACVEIHRQSHLTEDQVRAPHTAPPRILICCFSFEFKTPAMNSCFVLPRSD